MVKNSLDICGTMIRHAIADPHISVISFDIFDTLVVRPFWFPTDLFYFLDREASRILGTADIVSFSECRREAEHEARRRASVTGRQDIGLSEIYECIKEISPFPDKVVSALMQKELELELRFCTARKSALSLFQHAQQCGKRIIAISDMYLSSEFLQKLLIKNGFSGIEKIYVSCETGLTKASGDMYDHVIQDLDLERNEIIHIGDNLNTDIKNCRKHGWKAFPFYRPVDMLENEIPGKRYGELFKHAYKDFRSSTPNLHALDYLGIRCMLAVAANIVFDDPSKPEIKKGDYAGNPDLFGSVVLGMYVLSHGMWMMDNVNRINPDKVIFFSRDGYFPYLVFTNLSSYSEKPVAAYYARISRKALLPLLLYSDDLMFCSGNHIRNIAHSPESLTRLMQPVLKDNAESDLKERSGDSWRQTFPTVSSLMSFVRLLRYEFCDKQKINQAAEGFRRYFEPMMSGSVMTYDVGYNLRNEIMLRSQFPEVKMTACFTHTYRDMSLCRGKQGKIDIISFYPSSPYVSWFVRELFLTENAPACVGYTEEGETILSQKTENQSLVNHIQQYAVDYFSSFISIFQKDIFWLPVDYAAACLPMEVFIHSPEQADLHWVNQLEAENEADAGTRTFECQAFWRKLRTDYWISNHHLGKMGRHIVRFIMLLSTDREELSMLIHKRIRRR